MKNFAKRQFMTILFFLVITTFLALVNNDQAAKAIDNQWEVGADNEVELSSSACSISIRLTGSGKVTVTLSDGKKVSLDQSSNRLQLPCGSEVSLTADPSTRWRFDHWLGLPAVDQQNLTVAFEVPADITAVFIPRSVIFEPVETPFYDRDGEWVTSLELLKPIWRTLPENSPAAITAEAPVIDVWYGNSQSFGQHGTPQEWINILGNVSDKDFDLSKLSYTLNGGKVRTLEYGGSGSLNDTRRFANIGDFNIDIDKDDLIPLPSTNEVVIKATDSLGKKDEHTVTVRYDPGTYWPIPYRIDWDKVESITDATQIVDGKWYLEELQNGTTAGVRTLETGYDRIIAIGEGSFDEPGWTEFEATVPVTVHGYNGRAALGVVMRWQGHTDDPITCPQPKCGYVPVGGASWYRWNQPGKNGLSIWVGSPFYETGDLSGFQIELNKTYIWKVRVENNSNGSEGTYYVKVWPLGETEPKSWLVSMPGVSGSLKSGSLLLLAHYVDVTFGDVEICPVNGCPPLISDISVDPGITEATVSWKTDKPATSRVDYSSGSGPVQTVSDNAFVTSHSVILQNLEANTDYDFQIFSTDQSGKQAVSATNSFTTDPDTYTLDIVIIGQGSVIKQPDKPGYESGEQVILTAVPSDPKVSFLGWGIDASGNENPLKLIIKNNMRVQATFAKNEVGDFVQFLPVALGD